MKQKIGDFHVHSTGSDGELTPEEVIKYTIELGLPYICFTDHYHPPEDADVPEEWKKMHSDEYYKDVLKLKEKYKDKIEIYFGSEFSFYPYHIDWSKKEINKRDYDYCLGSVHGVYKNKKFYPVNWNEDIENIAVTDFEDIKDSIIRYYNGVRSMVLTGLFDSVAHFDLIKINNKNSRLFNENEEWYKKEVLETLDVIAKNKTTIEINTSGWKYPCKNIFPSLWILKEAKKREIPIIIGSDGHRKHEIGKGLKEAVEHAKKAGYDSIVKFIKRKPVIIKI